MLYDMIYDMVWYDIISYHVWFIFMYSLYLHVYNTYTLRWNETETVWRKEFYGACDAFIQLWNKKVVMVISEIGDTRVKT